MLKRLYIALVLVLALGAALAAPAAAGVIKLTTKVTTSVRDGQALLEVRLINLGSDDAYNIHLTARLLGHEVTAPGPGFLHHGDRAQLAMRLPFGQQPPGTYVAILDIRFQDANQYPFTSLAYAVIRNQGAGADALLARGAGVELAGEGDVAFELANMGDAPLEAVVEVFAPRELELGQSRYEVSLPGRAKRMVRAPVANFTAPVGASYPVLARVSYTSQGRHTALVAKADVLIKAAPDRLRQWRWPLAGLAAALALLIAGLELARRRARRKAA